MTNKGNDKQQHADSLIQQVIPNICTKFQNPWHSSSWEIFDTHFTMYYIGVREGKMEKRRQKLIIASCFFSNNILGPSQGVYKIWRLAVIAENSVTKRFIGEKEKWTNKRNDKQWHDDSLLHNTTNHTQHLYQISNFPMYYMGVRNGKKEKWKKIVKINLSILVLCPTMYLATLVYTKFEDFGSHRCRQICDRNFYWRERKMDN